MGWAVVMILAFGLVSHGRLPSACVATVGQKPACSLVFQITELLYSITFPYTSLPKFVENNMKLKKIRNKFLYNPLEYIYALGLTKSLFIHYCLLDKSK
jgi:hypothetical protein